VEHAGVETNIAVCTYTR